MFDTQRWWWWGLRDHIHYSKTYLENNHPLDTKIFFPFLRNSLCMKKCVDITVAMRFRNNSKGSIVIDYNLGVIIGKGRDTITLLDDSNLPRL